MVRPLISLIACSCLFLLTAATSSIGVIRSTGDFRVDGSTVRGNSTVFDGTLIETTTARSIVQLNGGQVTLAPESRAKVYHDRTVLEKGAGLLRDADKQVFEAASLQIAPGAKDSVIQVEVEGPGRIAVAARSGSALVHNSSGVLVASLRSGMELAFDNQPGTSTTTVRISGVIEERNGNYFIVDATTHVTFQIQGTNLGKYVGKKVDITGSVVPGSTPGAGATQVVQVTGIQLTPTGAHAGGSHVSTFIIIGGVVVGGTIVGMLAAGTFGGPAATSAQ
jgi:hypothetical protein